MPHPAGHSRPPVIVVANDQEWASRSLESLLGPRGYAVLRVSSGRQALELIRSTQPDALIVDAHTEDLSAVEMCRALKTDPQMRPGMPIFVTANDGGKRVERLEAFEAGAWDYCVQPIDGEVLLFKLATFLRPKQELDRALDERFVDEPTGLYTLRGLRQRALEIGAQASRKRHALTCIALTPVRDGTTELGWNSPRAASALASRMAGVLRKQGRVSDIFGRLGVAEFAILAPATDERGATRLLARLQAAVADMPTKADEETSAVRLLAGISSVPDYSQANVEVMEMLLRATEELRRVRTPAGAAGEASPG